MTDEQYIAELEEALEKLGWMFNDSLDLVASLQDIINYSGDEDIIRLAGATVLAVVPDIRSRFDEAFSEDSEYVKRQRARHAQ